VRSPALLARGHGIAVLGLAVNLALAAMAMACDVPVFRYALERWEPEGYSVCAVLMGDPTAEQTAELALLLNSSKGYAATTPANIELFAQTSGRATTGELAMPPPPTSELASMLTARTFDKPTFVVLSPQKTIVWTAPIIPGSASRILQSPARAAVTDHLLQGATAVWLLLEQGDKEKDEAFEASLRSLLAGAVKTLTRQNEAMRAVDAAEDADQQPAFTITFPIVRVCANLADEAFLSAMITGVFTADAGGATLSLPAAVPMFGRGRMLAIMTGNDLNAESILRIGAYLSGPCSCEAKALNPGVDLLFSADWLNAVTQTYADARILPPLPGPGDLMKANTERSGTISSRETRQPPTTPPPPTASSMQLYNFSFITPLPLILAVLIILAAASYYYIRKAG